MPGKTLLDTPFLDLLPRALRDDADVIAFAKTVDVLLSLIVPQIDNVRIWSRIDELEEPILSNLAFQLHLEGYEGWHLATTLEQKRGLLRDAIKTHYYKGTRWSLERTFELLDIPGDITEWWESSEGVAAFPPYTFDMDVHVGTRPVTPAIVTDTYGLIKALKNARSHLRRGFMHITGPTAPVHVGAATVSSSIVGVGPLRPTEIASTEKTPYVGAATLAEATVSVSPFRPTSISSLERAPRIGGGVFATATIFVGPGRETTEGQTV